MKVPVSIVKVALETPPDKCGVHDMGNGDVALTVVSTPHETVLIFMGENASEAAEKMVDDFAKGVGHDHDPETGECL